MRFPSDFVFGVATSAYQIEGAVQVDGRAPSQWDLFAHTPGKTFSGHTGDVACDHYRRYAQDVQLMAELGIGAYRFSFAWPRIITESGRENPRGIAFYERLIDELERHQIQPLATLYHWDLPLWLAERGGWCNRDTVGYFSDYAQVLFRRFGDRIPLWVTHNEPWCSAFLSYGMGEHAPGHHDWREAVVAAHHLMVSHGAVVRGFRQMALGSKIGISLNLNPVDPTRDDELNRLAAWRADGFFNRWFLDPLFKARYPDDMLSHFAPWVGDGHFILSGDLETIAQPLDFLGINYYTRAVVYDHPGDAFLGVGYQAPSGPTTAMGWEVHPQSLHQLIGRVNREYTRIPLYITENGAAYPDQVSPDGQVHDAFRIQFIRTHLTAALRTIAEGSTLKGYYLWSLLDNFEWAEGYSKRFGIVHVDFPTQIRRLKDSARWYRDVRDIEFEW